MTDPNRGAGEALPRMFFLTHFLLDRGTAHACTGFYVKPGNDPEVSHVTEYLSLEESLHREKAAADRARADGMKEARLWKKAAEEWMAAYDKLKQKYEPMHWVPSKSAREGGANG